MVVLPHLGCGTEQDADYMTWPAGSGKSSLLSAMLGLMQQVAGTPDAMRGKIAYVPQVCRSLWRQSLPRDGVPCGPSKLLGDISKNSGTRPVYSGRIRHLKH